MVVINKFSNESKMLNLGPPVYKSAYLFVLNAKSSPADMD